MYLVTKEVLYIKTTQKMTLYLHRPNADDIAQTAASNEKLQERMTRWNESFNRYNLKLNLNKKTEVLVVNRTANEAVVTLDEYQINQVTKFKYMGCIIGSKVHVNEEINGRISKMSQNVGMMYRLLKRSTCAQESETSDTHDHS